VTHQLLLELDRAPGTLQRLVGLVERRCFEILSLELNSSGGARQIVMHVQPSLGPKDFDVLCRQIDRLHGISRVEQPAGGHSSSMLHRFPLVG